MAKVIVTTSHDWRKIAELAGGDPALIMFDPPPSELEVPDVTQPALDTAFAAYVADQVNIDAATAAAAVVTERNKAVGDPDEPGATGMRSRALIALLNKRDNFLTNRVIELQDALAAMKATSGGIANLRGAIPGSFMPTATRTRANAIQDYKDDISAGNADN